MVILIGFIVTTFLVFLARISYLFFFDQQCEISRCLLQINDTQMLMYAAIILIGTYNAHLISKNKKYWILIFEFIGTFIFAFALNFIDLAK